MLMPVGSPRSGFIMQMIVGLSSDLKLKTGQVSCFFKVIKELNNELVVLEDLGWRPVTPFPNLCRGSGGLDAVDQLSSDVIACYSLLPS
jgi:hypothetical protein